MNNLMKLKQDRDTCYLFACAAYGQEFINDQLWEGDECGNEQFNKDIETIRHYAKELTFFRLVDERTGEGGTAGTPISLVQLPDGLWYEDDCFGRCSSDNL